MQFDHQVYLLTSPNTFFMFGSGMSEIMLYWVQSDSSVGTAYSLSYESENLNYLTVPFQSEEGT